MNNKKLIWMSVLILVVLTAISSSVFANSNLTVWDDYDVLTGQMIQPNYNFTVHANYTNSTNGTTLSDSNCNVTFTHNLESWEYSFDMGYNSSDLFYFELNNTLTNATGVVNYNVTCNRSDYDTLSTLGEFAISNNYIYKISTSDSNSSIFGDKIVYSNSSHLLVFNPNTNQTASTVPFAASYFDIAGKYIALATSGILRLATEAFTLPTNFFLQEPITTTNISQLLDISNSDDGNYSWRVRACDNAGANNSCVYSAENRTFTLDQTDPTITIDFPTTEYDVIAGPVNFRTSVNDDGVGMDWVTYEIEYSNSTTFEYANGTDMDGFLYSASDWDVALDFTDIINNITNLTFIVLGQDNLGNPQQVERNFTVDKRAPMFYFGYNSSESNFISDGELYTGNQITDGFSTYPAMNSTLSFYSSSNVLKFKQSQSTNTTQRHNYTDTVSISSWTDGQYSINFTGDNSGVSSGGSKTIFVDKTYPKFSNNRTIYSNGTNASSPFASESIMFTINWTEITLTNISIWYYNGTENASLYDAVNSSSTNFADTDILTDNILITALINDTLNIYFNATDAGAKSNFSSTSVFIQSTPPSLSQSFPTIYVTEDESNTTLNLSDYFTDSDADTIYDNLTFANNYSGSDLTISMNNNSGLLNITGLNDFDTNATVRFNATDYYGNYTGTNVTIIMRAVNDIPVLNNNIINLTWSEDTSNTSINISSSTYFTDADTLDTLTYSICSENNNTEDLTITINQSTGVVNITPDANFNSEQNGMRNVSFAASDGTNSTCSNVILLNVTQVNDAPSSFSLLSLSNGDTSDAVVELNWTESTDVDGDTINYSIYYNDGALQLAGWTLDTNYTWDASEIITGTESVGILIYANDSELYSTTTAITLTIDNTPPNVTLFLPNESIYNTTSNLNISFNATGATNCSYTIDGANESDTYYNTSSTINVSSNFNTSEGYHELNITCYDLIGNAGRNSTTFYSTDNNIIQHSFTTLPSSGWGYVNETINITLNITSVFNLSTINVSFTDPNGAVYNYTKLNFTPILNSGFNLFNYTLAEFNQTEVNGTYTVNLTIIDEYSNSASNSTTFDIFNSIDQEVNVN